MHLNMRITPVTSAAMSAFMAVDSELSDAAQSLFYRCHLEHYTFLVDSEFHLFQNFA